MTKAMCYHNSQTGGLLIMTLVFVSMFVVIFMSLAGLVGRHYKETVLQASDERAFQIAEAGLHFARWRLAHNDADLSEATQTVSDPQAGVLGSYTITFSALGSGNGAILITSEGRTAVHSERPVTIKARYGAPSLAQYALITNSDVWFAGEIVGSTHSNGGVRMDGQSDSVINSARETYVCKPVHGCANETKPAIWGSGANTSLWQYPVTAIDYASLTQNLLTIRQTAQDQGDYYAPSGVFGYHIVLHSNATYSLYRVTEKTKNISSFDHDTGWENSSYDIKKETLVATKSLPASGLIYTEDTLWLEGDVVGRITVAAGVFPDTPATNANIIINGDITYGGVKDGSRVLGVIAQKNVLIPYEAAKTNLSIQGAFIAQKGKFGRRHYSQGPNKLKDKLSLYGMIASNGTPATAWVDGTGAVGSGYAQGESIYDPNLQYDPPPYFPTTGQYEFLSWEQVH